MPGPKEPTPARPDPHRTAREMPAMRAYHATPSSRCEAAMQVLRQGGRPNVVGVGFLRPTPSPIPQFWDIKSHTLRAIKRGATNHDTRTPTKHPHPITGTVGRAQTCLPSQLYRHRRPCRNSPLTSRVRVPRDATASPRLTTNDVITRMSRALHRSPLSAAALPHTAYYATSRRRARHKPAPGPARSPGRAEPYPYRRP
jgi:hypothetical protein